jgi:NAD(P)-dependent dehydrogenase (short-subunit alcohol dehydrogenase family)
MHISRVIYISGGAQGIGKGIARHLLHHGYTVVIADIDAQAGEETAAQYAPLGPLRFMHTDIREEADVRDSIAETVQRFGRLDGLINNAALANPYHEPIEQLSLESWQRVLATNLDGAFLCTKHAVPLLRQSGGCIINIASTRALQSETNSEAYAASKGALVALTHALAISLGPAIRVNSISPGWIDVSEWQKSSERRPAELSELDHLQHPAGRVGTPADVAAMVAFLLSEEAGFITAQNFVVDGGITRKMIYEE